MACDSFRAMLQRLFIQQRTAGGIRLRKVPSVSQQQGRPPLTSHDPGEGATPRVSRGSCWVSPVHLSDSSSKQVEENRPIERSPFLHPYTLHPLLRLPPVLSLPRFSSLAG